MALDEPTEQDVVEVVNGIKVAFEKAVHGQTDQMSLDLQETEEGAGLVMTGNESDCC